MRIAVGDDLEPRRLQARHRVRRRHLDPIDLARAQRGESGRRFRHRNKHHLVEFRYAARVPITVITGQRGADARLKFGDLEGTRARRRLAKLGPRAGLLELCRAREEEIRKCPGEIAHRAWVADFDRVVVDLAKAGDPRVAGAGKGAAGRIGLRYVRLEIAVEVPDHCIGVEVAAVVKLDTVPQVENPFRHVSFVLLPALGEPRPDLGQPVGARQVPQHQAFIDRIAEKTQAFETIVRRARGRGHVGGGHRDPQCSPGLRRRRGSKRRQ